MGIDRKEEEENINNRELLEEPRELVLLSVGLGGVLALVDNQILGAVVLAAGEVRVQDGLGSLGVADLGIDGRSRHVGDHGVSTAPWVLGVAERMVLGSRLDIPHVSSISCK